MPGQNRNRDTKKYLDNGVSNVDDKWKNLGVLSVFGHAIEENGVIVDFALTAPEGTNVEKVLKEIPKEYLNKILEAAYLDNATRQGAEKDDIIAKKRKQIDDVRSDAEKSEFVKPCKPVYVFTELDMRTFFPRFVRSVLKRENINMKGKTLWATKKVDEEGREFISPPVQVPFWNKNIIDPNYYFGQGKKYRFGNILHRQIMQVANILILNNINPDTFCERVPPGYVPKHYTIEEIVGMGGGEKAAEQVKARNTETLEEVVQDAIVVVSDPGDVFHNEDLEEVPELNVEEPGPSVQVSGHSVEEPVQNVAEPVPNVEESVHTVEEPLHNIEESGRSDEVPAENANIYENDDNFNTPAKFSRKNGPVIYGTPAVSSPPKTYFGMVPGSLRGAFLGNQNGSSLVFQLVAIQHANQLNCYRVSLSDGKELSNNILFYQNLNSRVKAFVQAVENGTFPFVNILEYDILGNTHLVIADFKFVTTFPSVIGSPTQIEEKFFENLKKGLKNLPNTNKMRGMFARNIPSSKRKICPDLETSNTPVQKKTRTKRRLV